jgi:hypothetical protein
LKKPAKNLNLSLVIKNEDLNSGNQLSQGDTPGMPQGFCAGFLPGPGFTGGGAGCGDGAGFAGAGFAGAGFAGADFAGASVDIVIDIIYSPCC